jgi:hypothetical protein
MEKKRVRGMRDIPTVQGLRHHSVPTTREEAVAELARMEHEKARLERELDMWLGNQRTTEDRLRQVETRLALLDEILNPSADEEAPGGTAAQPGTQRKRRARRGSASAADSGENERRNWKEIPLEY